MKDPKGPVKSYKSPEELAKKHNVSLATIMKQVEIGTKVEGEHTTSKSGARITALQHIDELPDYYTRLKKVEKKTMKKEEVSVEQQYEKDTKYCLLCKKNEKRSECSYGPQMWDRYTIAKIHPTNESKIHEDHKEIASGKKKDEEGYMANIEMDKIERCIGILRKIIKKPEQQLPAWVQSKITRAADFIDTASEYLSSDEMSEGMSLADFMNARKKRERSQKRKELSPTRRAGIHNPEKKLERDARRDAAYGETGHGGPLRPKKVRKARAVGELTKEEIVLEKRGLWDNIHARRKKGLPPKKPGEKGYPKTLDIEEGLKQARKNVGASKCWTNKKVDPNKPTKMKGGKEVPNCVPANEDTCLTFSEFMAEVAAWQRKEGKNPEGGLNERGRKSYERENPGSDLKAPQPEGGPRKRSFCARMGGMPGPMKDEKGRPTRKALALRKWKC
jgi:hypothetical protein